MRYVDEKIRDKVIIHLTTVYLSIINYLFNFYQTDRQL